MLVLVPIAAGANTPLSAPPAMRCHRDREGEAFEGDRTLAAMKKWIDLHVRAPDKEDL